MDLEIKKGEKIAPENLHKYYEDEILRVAEELENAKKKLMDLKQSKVWTEEKAAKITELNYAVAIGKMYLMKLKRRV